MIVWLSQVIMPLAVGYIVAFGLISGRPVFEDFLAGAQKGMRSLAELLPVYVGFLAAVGVLRASGLLDAISGLFAAPLSALHFPLELVPVVFIRLISNSAATGLLLDLFRQYGPDAPVCRAASVMLSSTETVFYCLSLYFGAAKVTRTRYAVWGALFSTIVGIGVSLFLCLR